MGTRWFVMVAETGDDSPLAALESAHSFDWWGPEQLMVYGLGLFALMVLVFAGSWGFVGFTRKLAKEGHRVASGRWPNQ